MFGEKISDTIAMSMTKFFRFLPIRSLQKIWTQSSCFGNHCRGAWDGSRDVVTS